MRTCTVALTLASALWMLPGCGPEDFDRADLASDDGSVGQITSALVGTGVCTNSLGGFRQCEWAEAGDPRVTIANCSATLGCQYGYLAGDLDASCNNNPYICPDGACSCSIFSSQADCSSQFMCDWKECANDSQCSDPYFCSNNTCTPPACTRDSNCPSNKPYCIGSGRNAKCSACRASSDCPSASYGGWSACSYSDTCDESGTRSRNLTSYTCSLSSGACVASTTRQSSGCSRITDGLSCSDGNACTVYDACSTSGTCSGRPKACPATSYGSWSTCTYATACAIYGTQSRKVTSYGCRSSDGACVASTRTEKRSCGSRITEGRSCGYRRVCSPSGVCMPTGMSAL